MAVAFLLEWDGVGSQLYDAVVGRTGRIQPPGNLYHVAGPIEHGWRVVDVWESPEVAQRFYSQTLAPVSQEMGLPAPSRQDVFPVHDSWVGRQS